MSSVCFNAAHCCVSQKSAYNISQGFLHQKQNHFIFHDISFPPWSLELKAVFATVLLDLYVVEKTLKTYNNSSSNNNNNYIINKYVIETVIWLWAI